ncbi:MAG: CDP-alcohol phosphatidyltransferase family protein [Gammaproteobacteria bacterium]|nr:CDP-alcohol phosphatidyltransferase family protein [Gammaproteobacteria bacterium]
MISQFPNLLTISRIAAAPVLILLLRDRQYDIALLIFVLAGISDGLDGFIAKRYNLVSRLGAILDALADKILLISVYVMLTVLGHIPFWLLLAVGFRDLLIVGGYLVLVTLDVSVHRGGPSRLSKVNTCTQIALVIVILAQEAGWVVMPWAVEALVVVVLITTVLSGAHYLWLWGIKRQTQSSVDSEVKVD